MANIFRRAIGRIANLFGKKPKKPARPQIGGHRGIAMGSRNKPKLESYQGRLERSHETIGESEVADFLLGEAPLFVHSSNVVSATYQPGENKMLVEFRGGKRYLYSDIPEAMAITFAQAQSKGSWIWDNLRIRGTKDGHRKPFVRLVG